MSQRMCSTLAIEDVGKSFEVGRETEGSSVLHGWMIFSRFEEV